MRVAFDWQIFCMQAYGGISRYYARLAEQLLAGGTETRIYAPLHQNSYLDALPGDAVYGRRFPAYPRRTGRAFLAANGLMARAALRRWRPEIVHQTYYAARPFRHPDSAAVVTVYDMIHEKFPASFPMDDPTAALKLQAVRRADHVTCISESTRRDLLEISGIDPKKVSVVYLGYDRMPVGAMPEALRGDGRPFLLYVGNRGGYKNFSTLIEAFACEPRLREAFDLVAFGGGSFSVAEEAMLIEAGLRVGQCRQVGGADEVLGALYAAAFAMVYPSHYEGFGLPPLEAMAQDCPVIASNTSSMPEIIGDAGEYFDPASAEELAAAVLGLASDDDRRQDLVAAGQQRLEMFTWPRCAAAMRTAYQQLVAA